MSWAARTPEPLPPERYRRPAPPWRPAGRRPLTTPPRPRPRSARPRSAPQPRHVESLGHGQSGIDTDHGSESEGERPASYVQYVTSRGLRPEHTDVPESDVETCGSAWSTTRVERLGGSVWLSLRRLSLSEPLRLELRLGGQVQCLEARRPRAVGFAVEDLRARPLLELSLWDGLQEQCVAAGRARLGEGKELVAQLRLNSGGRGVAVFQQEVRPSQPQLVVYGHGDALCSRSLSLYQRESLAAEDLELDVDARCWSYLEQRFEPLRLKRRQRQWRVRCAQARRTEVLEAEPPVAGRLRVTEGRAARLQRFLRPLVKGDTGRRVLSACAEAFEVEEFEAFLKTELRAPVCPDDLAELRSLLLSEGKVHLQDLLRFVESGVQVVPAARVVYPDEERAREIFKELFPNFLAKEQKREELMAVDYDPW